MNFSRWLLVLVIVYHVESSARIRGRRGLVHDVRVEPTMGEPWPKPQSIQTTGRQFAIHPDTFHFRISNTSQSCDLLTGAFVRYYRAIFYPKTYLPHILRQPDEPDQSPMNDTRWRKSLSDLGDTPLLGDLFVHLQQPCDQWPSLESNESYVLVIRSDQVTLNAVSIWGALRGLETFSQLIYTDENDLFAINETTINDFPRFQHRGLLLDTSRHFLSVDIIKTNLEAMAQSKLNVFHFHIVDDQSFPYESRTFPELSNQGAYTKEDTYSQADIAEIIEFARQRGIRVVIEFDSPGHTLSWGYAIDILTHCYTFGKPNGKFGPVDPSRNSTFEFLKRFFAEIAGVFPDRYIHLGGDEVEFECWRSNPAVQEFMRQMKFGADFSLLEQYYMQTLVDIVNTTGKGYAVWQEIIDHHVKVKADTVVEVWKEPQSIELARVTSLGYRTILSACWYLNLISYGQDWFKYYRCDPHDFIGTEKQKKLVIGGEASMWGEYVDSTNVIQMTWPRAAVVAERLWSSAEVKDHNAAIPRLEEQRCRYLKRGIAAAPINGPSFCRVEYRTQRV